MDWTRQIDIYCERLGPGFWAEPVNALTNAAFIVAALVGLLAARRAGRLDGPTVYLCGLAAVIGIGSFLFHTFATAWAAMADRTPIMLFILSYFAVAMNRFAGFGWGRSLLLTLVFLGAVLALSWGLRMAAPPHIGRSTNYVPALLALIAVGLWLRVRGHRAGLWLIAAGGTLALSLFFRTIDSEICDAWPIGTHFLWHVLNGVVLGTLLVALVRHGAARRHLAGRACIA